MENLKQTGPLPLSDEEVFDEIIRRIVNNHFDVFFLENRYYRILSERFLQGYEYDLDSLEPVRCWDSEEDVRKIDEWLAFQKVYYALEGRPGHRPWEELFEKTWIDYFKTWVLPIHDASSVIDWILSLQKFSKNRTRTQIVELLGCNNIYMGVQLETTPVLASSANEKMKRGRSKKRRELHELLNIENDALWESLMKKMDELQNRYTKPTSRALIVWALYYAVEKKNRKDLNAREELFEAFKKERPSFEVEIQLFRKVTNKKEYESHEAYKIAIDVFRNLICSY